MFQITYCEKCGGELPVVAAYCTKCGTHRIPAPPTESGVAPPSPPEPIDDGGYIECPQCAEPIRERAKVCRFCGYDLVDPPRVGEGRSDGYHRPTRHVRVEHTMARSPGTAAVLAFFWPGLGHIYAGRLGRGLAIMIGPSVIFVVAFLALTPAPSSFPSGTGGLSSGIVVLGLVAIGFHVWQIFDAYACAQPPPAERSRRHR